MYEPFFGLRTRPFCASLDPDWFVAAGNAARTLAELTLCARDGRGIGILCAEAGLGKTLICRRLARDLSHEFAVAFLTTAGFPGRRALLQAILFELGRRWEGLDESELRLAVHAAARDVRPAQSGLLLIVDEAHLLDEQLLEEIRVAANLMDDGRPLFRIVLSGQVGIDEMLARPGLDAFRERIGCQTSLERLSQSESAEYLRLRMALAEGRLEEGFSPDALRLICHAADGSPRALNHLADHVLLLGYVHERKPADEAVVRMAFDDLRRLPIQWNEPAVWTDQAPSAIDDEGFAATDPPVLETAAVSACDSMPAAFADFAARETLPSIEVGAGPDEWLSAAHSPPVVSVDDESGDAIGVPVGAEDEEVVADPWPMTVSGPDVFEAVASHGERNPFRSPHGDSPPASPSGQADRPKPGRCDAERTPPRSEA